MEVSRSANQPVSENLRKDERNKTKKKESKQTIQRASEQTNKSNAEAVTGLTLLNCNKGAKLLVVPFP